MRHYRTRKSTRKHRGRKGGMRSNSSNTSKHLGSRQRGYTISHESSESNNIENMSQHSNKPITVRRRRADSHEASDDYQEEPLKPLTRKEIIDGAWRISKQMLARKKKEHQELMESEHGRYYKRYLASKQKSRKSKK